MVKPCNGHSFYPNDCKLSFVFLYCNFLLIISQYIHQYQYICHKLISTNKSAWLIPDLRSNCGQYNIIITKTNNSQRYRNKTQFVIQTNYPLKKKGGKILQLCCWLQIPLKDHNQKCISLPLNLF